MKLKKIKQKVSGIKIHSIQQSVFRKLRPLLRETLKKIGDKMAHVGIIIVTYNPVMKNFENNLSYIKKLKQKILIVDNNSNLKEIKRLRNIAKQNYNVSLIELDKNMGIGYAQNIGINYFKNKGVDFCFFLDQDSYIKEAHFKKLVNDFEQIRIIDKNAVLMGPILNESDLLRDNISKVNKLISSGSLMVLEATSSVGLMKEKFFIDFIDYEWCWRARKKEKIFIRMDM